MSKHSKQSSSKEMSEHEPDISEDLNCVSRNYLAGVEEDVKSLLGRVNLAFDHYEELRFYHFVEVWKDMQFEHIFRGREGFRDTFEFTEGLLRVVKDELISPDVSLGYRAAGIYALYALFFRQPPHIKAVIRLTLSELQEIKKATESLSEGQHWDVLYCWSRLLVSGAFHFSAQSRLLGLDAIGSLYVRKEQASSLPFSNPFKSSGFMEQVESLRGHMGAYLDMKNSLTSRKEDPSLFLLNKDFEGQINDIVESAFAEREIVVSKQEEGEPEDNVGDRRQRLLNKHFTDSSQTKRQKEIQNFKKT